ncbi:hypothetical protein CEXT_108261 [Caerostris extrusa]|uniref:Immunoglobulin I-set domain-containing protein n=1 Tax=Caerostris extrusa TaxID=172846 RepID=A0AAV4VYC1_CAEEX|nr:hypothetical protein CEXT_108261 [Caerostris extrusa]
MRGGEGTKLVIEKTEREDSASFTCTAMNDFGEDSMNFQLTVQGKQISNFSLVRKSYLLCPLTRDVLGNASGAVKGKGLLRRTFNLFLRQLAGRNIET